METILNLLINPQSLQTLLLAAICCSGFVWLKMSLGKQINVLDRKIDGVEASLKREIDDLRHNDLAAMGKRIDGVEVSLGKQIYELKYNDFAHLNSTMEALKSTVEALTFTLEKNGSLTKEDKEFVDSRLTV